MKKILIATNILFLVAVIVLASYRNKSTAKGDLSPVCQSAQCMGSFNSQDGRITAYTAKMLSDNYKNDDSKNFIWSEGKATSREDARSIWFSLETLKGFIHEIESAACRDSCNSPLGIRMYYARYPGVNELKNSSDLTGINLEYANRHTIFMVPTYWNAAVRQYIDFNPNNGCRGAFNILDGNKRAMIFLPSSTTEVEEGAATQNHGGLAPPPSTTTAGTFPTTTSSF